MRLLCLISLEKIEERKEEPILVLLQELGGWPILSTESSVTSIDWVDLMARLRLYNNDLLVSMWVGLEGRNSEAKIIHVSDRNIPLKNYISLNIQTILTIIIQLDQGDLGLPSRSYYLGQDNSTTTSKVLDAYSNFIRQTALALGGKSDVVEKDLVSLIEFETELAKVRNFTLISFITKRLNVTKNLTGLNF